MPCLFNHYVCITKSDHFGVLSLFMWGRSSFVGKGGDQYFFPKSKGGTSIFSRMQRGGPEKIDDRLSQIDGPPLPVKNDSSLTLFILPPSYCDAKNIQALEYQWLPAKAIMIFKSLAFPREMCLLEECHRHPSIHGFIPLEQTLNYPLLSEGLNSRDAGLWSSCLPTTIRGYCSLSTQWQVMVPPL